MTDTEKLTIAIDALKEIASQECNLRQGGCVPVLGFEGLEDGLTTAVDEANNALRCIVAPNAGNNRRSQR